MSKAVLFDLDGTLLDTGPDFEFIVNTMRVKQGLGPVDYASFRPKIACGSVAMTEHGLNLSQTDPMFDTALTEFYQRYMETMGTHARIFPGIQNLLDQLEQENIPWGIVTNRKLDYIPPILKRFKLDEKAACIVGSDSTAYRKPHPGPLLHGASLLNINAEHCFYVGDFPTDIEAANAAKMESVAVTWGYHDGIASLKDAKPNFIVDSPDNIYKIISQT